jgi:hypothetical protein
VRPGSAGVPPASPSPARRRGRRRSQETRVNLLKANYLSFFDKKDLTNGIDGFILCAMNANEISPKANFRMNRIQKIGALLRTFFFIAALFFWVLGICYILFSILNPNNFVETWRFFFFVYAAECVLAYKLFSIYARGDLFAADAVRYVRGIGVVTFLIGIGEIHRHFVGFLNHADYFVGSLSVKGILGLFILGFLELFLNLVPGFVIIFIAWIMDEGRKIQEEQELTV